MKNVTSTEILSCLASTPIRYVVMTATEAIARLRMILRAARSCRIRCQDHEDQHDHDPRCKNRESDILRTEDHRYTRNSAPKK